MDQHKKTQVMLLLTNNIKQVSSRQYIFCQQKVNNIYSWQQTSIQSSDTSFNKCHLMHLCAHSLISATAFCTITRGIHNRGNMHILIFIYNIFVKSITCLTNKSLHHNPFKLDLLTLQQQQHSQAHKVICQYYGSNFQEDPAE